MVALGVNISGLQALRQLGRATDELSRVSERLSSGQRINRASDDAAGLAIASGLVSKGRIYTQSIRNLNDGISALAIADGAAGELSSVLTRLQELSAQAANGSYSSTQRRALDNEAQKLRDEFNRLVATTSFNGTRLLDQNTGRIRLEAGVTTTNGALYIDPSNLGVGSKSSQSFSATPLTSNAGATGYEVATADINSDGILDLVRDDNTNGGLIAMLGNGDGSFKSSASIANSKSIGAYYSIRLVDLNGDGNVDIIAGGDKANVFLGNGDGSFKNSSAISGLSNVQAVKLVDWNGDGKLDLATGNDVGTLELRLGNGNGTFGSATFSLATGLGGISAFEIGDLDGDGRLDAAVGSSSSPVVIFYNDGSGGLNSSGSSLPTGTGTFIGDIALADMNGDGRLDVLSTKFDGSVNYYQNLGSQTFATEASVALGGSKLSIVDQDGDGSLDVISVSASGGITINYGNGNGTFQSGKSIPGGGVGFGLATGDFNGDGVIDVTLTDSTGTEQYTNLSQTSAISYLGDISLTTRSGALTAMRTLASAQSALGSARGRIGADQSRLASSLNTIGAARDNFLAAAGRIQDADIAAETASLTRSRILQQSAAQVLAQVSLQPELALRLLQ